LDNLEAIIQSELSHATRDIYLNHAGIAPWPKRTVEAVKSFAEDDGCLGALRYPDRTRHEDSLRLELKHLLNAPDVDDIALAKNTSEALSFVAYGLAWRRGDNIVASNEEFPSNRIPWQSLADQGVEFRQADLQSAASPEDALFDLVDRSTRLITVSSVQFASGIRLHLERIGEFCRQRDILFCVDAIQSLGALRFDVQTCQADFVMADGHKWMLAPEGLGVFFTTPRARESLRLTQYGWHMIENHQNYDNRAWQIARTARRFECGSGNFLGVYALSASLSLLHEISLQTIEQRILERTAYLMEAISRVPVLELLTPTTPALRSGIVVFRHRHLPSEPLYARLRSHGVVCALRGGGIRFSPHFYTPFPQLETALSIASAQ
jgi:cysteine desulfurase/selenocysteine lyase